MDTSSSMDTLPVEVITNILQYLKWVDKQSASLVCKRWYRASIDPCINCNTTFKLRCDDIVKPSAEELEGVSHRKIPKLGIHGTTDKLYKEVQSCSGFRRILGHITTIEMTESTPTTVEVFIDIVSHCPKIQTVQMSVHSLFMFLQKDTSRTRMIAVLENLLGLILNLGSSTVDPEEIEYLMILPKVVKYLTIRRAELSPDCSMEELNICVGDCYQCLIPISTLTSFCEKHDCLLNIGFLDCSKNQIRLSQVLGVLGGFSRLTIGGLDITLYSASEVRDLNQLPDFSIELLELNLGFNTDEWFTPENLSHLVSVCPSLNHLNFSLQAGQGTLDCFFESLPVVELIQVGQYVMDFGFPQQRRLLPEDRRSRYIHVMYRTEIDGRSKWLMINDTNTQEILITRPSVTFSVVDEFLEDFAFEGVFNFDDPEFILKLTECFPELTRVSLKFITTVEGQMTGRDLSNQIDLGIFSRFKNLQELTLEINVYLAKVKLQGFQFCELEKLSVRSCINMTNECLEEIARSMQNLESLDISDCLGIGDVALQSVLKSLNHLRELKVVGCEQVNATTLKMISNCSSSLRILWVSEGNEEITAAIKEINESSSNLQIKYETWGIKWNII